MGSLNDLPNNPASDRAASDQLLSEIKQNLQAFQQDLVSQLTADVGRLQAEKVELLTSISDLKREQKALQAQQQTLLSQQQIAQQKLWAKQLAEALANRLYILLAQKIGQRDMTNGALQPTAMAQTTVETSALPPALTHQNRTTQQALQVLNHNLSSALGSLQEDLNQDDSPLVQQIRHDDSVNVQGEVLLNQLMQRLKQQLQGQTPVAYPSPMPSPLQPVVPSPRLNDLNDVAGSQPERNGGVVSPPDPLDALQGRSPSIQLPTPGAPAASPPPLSPPSSPSGQGDRSQADRLPRRSPSAEPLPLTTVQQWARRLNLTKFQLGLILVLLSTLCLSLHNVVVGIIGNESSLFNRLPSIGGVVTLASLDSSLLLLWLRMIVVVPLMAIVATLLYPPTWRDVKSFFLASDPVLLGTVIGSGGFLFLSQVLIYIAIGQVGPGIAVTLLFMYPIVTVPLAWYFFNDRPTALRWLVLAGVFFGIVLTTNVLQIDVSTLQFVFNPPQNFTRGGIGVALLSGLFFAMYLISMQLSFRKLHPVPVSVIQFSTIFSLTSIILIAFPTQPENINLSSHLGLLIGALILGTLTLLGYLLNNFGIRYMGAARASIIASSGPALTAFLGYVMVPVRFNLQGVQWLGIFLVTICVASLSLERLFMQPKS